MKKALVVGLNNYPGCALNWCDNDAIEINSLIKTNGDGSPNFDSQLIVDECRQIDLRSKIEELFKDDSEIALLYFSGHGAESDGGYLVTTDFTDNSYGVRMTDIMNIANHSDAKNKVIILDCCFAGNMGKSIFANNQDILSEGVTIIAASQADETSAESSTIGHGIFTNLLIQGLQGGAADIGGNITPASLYAFVDQSLGAWQQRPVFKTNISQFLPIRRITPKVPDAFIREIPELFPSATDEFPLDPSYEFTNDPSAEHEVVEPYANKEHVKVFKKLQLFESVGLVEPVDEDHMYFAAMHNKSCRLTALGLHYWRLAKDERY